VLIADNGTDGLAIAREFKPHAIILDLILPGLDGWTVLDRLKHDPDTRHIPLYIVSMINDRQRSAQQGAVAHLAKPVTREALAETMEAIQRFNQRATRHLLLIEDNEIERNNIIALIGDHDIQITTASTGAEALSALESQDFDCLVLDLGLPDMTGFDLITQIKARAEKNLCPVIIYTAKDLTPEEEAELQNNAVGIIVKDIGAPERLFDLTTLFLHRAEANLSEPKRHLLTQIRKNNGILAGKKVLIIDDDIRNIFAMTSMLEHHQIQVTYAENGEEGLRLLQDTPDIDIVMLDIMMPGIDGYQVLRFIRNMEQFKSLPIIAVTAKAMKGDREKCLEAGASAYITKPVEVEQLLSLLRVWLYP
ncbi:MAG: response regulator, partial [Chloroflexi bacterium]|nr:response regulator [Chloroflexota bacterium]